MHRLFLAELKRSWTEFIRYPSEALTGVITLTAIFAGLFLGARYMAGPAVQFGFRLDMIIVGYLLWSLTLVALSVVGWTIQFDAQTGILEQIYLSPHGPTKVFLARAVASLLVQLGIIVGVLFLILLITGRRLHFSLGMLPPVLAVILATFGLGFILGGLALIFKRIHSVLQIAQFAILLLVVAPVETWEGPAGTLGCLLPLAPSSGMLRDLMVRGTSFDLVQFAVACLNGLAFFALGLLVFRIADGHARRRGSLGAY